MLLVSYAYQTRKPRNTPRFRGFSHVARSGISMASKTVQRGSTPRRRAMRAVEMLG